MQSLFENYGSSHIHYLISGNAGNPILVCFHGYGESAESFHFLEKYIGDDFTIIAIDLPFHGKTIWNEGLDFAPADLWNIMQQIIKGQGSRYKAQEIADNPKICLAGFSMGARVALGMLQYKPGEIKKITCLSPDGLKVNGWYWLATQTKAGNLIFKTTMKMPGLVLGTLRASNKLHIIKPSTYRFIDYYLETRKARNELYKRWTTMRKFSPNLRKIKNCIRAHSIPVKLLYGRHDNITRHETGNIFMQGMEGYCELCIIPGGHNVLHEKNIEQLVSLLKD